MTITQLRTLPLFILPSPSPALIFRGSCRTHIQPIRTCQTMEQSSPSRYKKLQSRLNIDKIEAGAFKICGISIAATETCIWIPSLSLAFDAGKCPLQAIGMRYMAITHGHCDHVHGLPLHLATRTLQKMSPPIYFVPPAIRANIEELVSVVAKLEESDMQANIRPLSPSDDMVELKRGWLLKSFQTYHTVPSQGYIVYQRRRKLKSQYLGRSADELTALKQCGTEIDRVEFVPEIAFTGDTSLDTIAQYEDVRRATVLITEMTFLDDIVSAADSRAFGHIHLDEVVERAELFRDNRYVIFTHFSARYSEKYIREAMQKLPQPLRSKSQALGVGPITSHTDATAQGS